MKNRIIASIVCATLVLPAALSLGGCAMGNESLAKEDATTLQQKITKGKTTKAEIQTMFGEPSEKGIRNGREYWMYRLQTASAKTFIPFAGLATGNSGTEIKDLTIDFNKAGVVVNYDLAQSKG
ncbi:MAG: outer membrane protein assembly factor BamE [Burkholderiaceae bacterium]|nr:outer membrane protein assembly factor BamE [Burkholderiaceae bacterium]